MYKVKRLHRHEKWWVDIISLKVQLCSERMDMDNDNDMIDDYKNQKGK